MQWRRRGIQKKRSERGGIRAGDEVGVSRRRLGDGRELLTQSRHGGSDRALAPCSTSIPNRYTQSQEAEEDTNHSRRRLQSRRTFASAGLCQDSSLGQDSTLRGQKKTLSASLYTSDPAPSCGTLEPLADDGGRKGGGATHRERGRQPLAEDAVGHFVSYEKRRRKLGHPFGNPRRVCRQRLSLRLLDRSPRPSH